MRIREKALAAALALCTLSSPLIASPGAAYEVSVVLSHAGEPFAAPTATVKAGQPASVEVTGPKAHKITLEVTDLARDEIQISATVASPHGSMAPTVVLRPGEPGRVSVGALSLELTVKRTDG
ncbi:MAG: hypothetical protein DDT39_01665 [Firmicutes bacterium]|nr:hypothetical protein [candidate division NPL-UPA2 bacterium]